MEATAGDMRKSLAKIGLILLILAGFPLLFGILSLRSFLGGFSEQFPNNTPSGELQGQIVMFLLLMGIIALQSLGIIMITVIDAASPTSKSETKPTGKMEVVASGSLEKS